MAVMTMRGRASRVVAQLQARTRVTRMADVTGCWARAMTLDVRRDGTCPLVMNIAPLPACASCAAFTSTEAAYRAHLADGWRPMPLTAFVDRHMALCGPVRHMRVIAGARQRR